jgi:hypothetical protein
MASKRKSPPDAAASVGDKAAKGGKFHFHLSMMRPLSATTPQVVEAAKIRQLASRRRRRRPRVVAKVRKTTGGLRR